MAKKPKRQRHPRAIERAYLRAMRAIIADMRKATARAIVKLRAIDAANKRRTDDARADVDDRNAREVTTVIKGLRAQFDTIVRKARPGLIAQGIGKKTAAFASKAVDESVRGIVTIPAREVATQRTVDAFAGENVDLIKSIGARLHGEVADIVDESWSKGRTVDDIASRIADRFGVTDRRAQLIARDQIGKLNAKVTESRHRQIGITKFSWSTARDERVRGNPAGPYADAEFSHWEREGQVFSYDDPPEDGLPGEAIQCRCVAIPIIDDLEEES